MIEHDLIRIQRTGDRIRNALRELVENFPPEARTISGMARWLGISKATCQRVVEGIARECDGFGAYSRLPGVRGLFQHVHAAAEHGAAPHLVEAALAAITDYAALFDSFGKSQNGMVEHINALRAAAQGPDALRDRRLSEDHRRALFDAAKRVTGEEVAIKSVVTIVSPHAANAALLDAATISTLSGVRRQAFSRPIVPFVLMGNWSRMSPGDPSGTPASEAPPPFELVREFSTIGLRPSRVVAAEAKTLLVADLNAPDPTSGWFGPADISILFRLNPAPNPLLRALPHLNFAARIVSPTRSLVHDTFIHRSLAAACSPAVAAYSLSAPPGDLPEGSMAGCWYERFPDTPELRVLGHPGSAPPSALFSQQSVITAYAFEKLGLPTDEYLGYRCEVHYPMWQADYRTYFEFAANAAEAAAPVKVVKPGLPVSTDRN